MRHLLSGFQNSDWAFTSSLGGKWGKRGAESTQLAQRVRFRNMFRENSSNDRVSGNVEIPIFRLRRPGEVETPAVNVKKHV